MNKVIPKTLWTDQVIQALTVTKLHIKRHHTIYNLYVSVVKTPAVDASLFGTTLQVATQTAFTCH